MAIATTIISLEFQIEALKAENEYLRKLAFTDRLTGLGNRLYFDSRLESVSDFSVIMIDLDFLKKANDSEGHEAGDTLIVMLACVIRLVCSSNDVMTRWGGDEFAILLPGQDLNQASKKAHELLHELKNLNMSASIGVSQRKNNETRSEAIKRADAAAYVSKQTRGRVTIAS